MSENQIPRRAFLRTSIAGAGLAAAGGLSWAQSAETTSASESEGTMPDGVLGRTGVRISKLGIGCAPFQAKSIDSDHVRSVLERALELGVTYLDVAPNYGNADRGFSEEKMGPALKGIRDRFFLVTKTESKTRDGTWRLLEQSMKRMQTDRLDLVHLHNFGFESRFPDLDAVFGKEGALGALQEARDQGVIRFIGGSGHLYPSRFHAVLDTGEIDVLMNAVNFVVQHVYDFEHKVWSRARRENIGLVAMKVLGGSAGNGYRMPSKFYEQAIRYALSIPGLSTAVIGIQNRKELEQAAQVVRNARPLSTTERHELSVEGLRLAAKENWSQAYGTPLT